MGSPVTVLNNWASCWLWRLACQAGASFGDSSRAGLLGTRYANKVCGGWLAVCACASVEFAIRVILEIRIYREDAIAHYKLPTDVLGAHCL